MYGKNTSIIEDIRNQFRSGSMTNRLILVNIIVFVGLLLVKIVLAGFMQHPDWYQTFKNFFTLPSGLRVLLKPWTLFSYMFVHEGFLHIIFNLLILYWFGNIFTIFLNEKKLLPLYVYGGLAGGIVYWLIAQIYPSMNGVLLGASASIMAIVFAVTTLSPDYVIRLMFIGNVRLKYLALALILFDLMGIAFMSNTGGHFAHLGGGLLGFVFIKQLQAGNDWSVPFNRLVNRVSGVFKPAPKTQPRVVYRRPSQAKTASQQPASAPTASSTPYGRKVTKDQQGRIDEILDKISQSGYESLTREEKEFLFRLKDDK